MPVEYFFRYKGLCYDVGTKVKVKTIFGVEEGVVTEINLNSIIIKGDLLFEKILIWYIENRIVEIVEPVYYKGEIEQYTNGKNNMNYPSEDSIFIGWILYILIMVVGTIFNERLMIWIFATAYFFLWKNGFMGKRG